MITITIDQLMTAAMSGALTRFFACSLSIPAWKALRHTAEACDKEVQRLTKKRDELVAEHGGKVNATKTGWNFPNEDATTRFAAAWNELISVQITDIPGDLIKIEDIQNGSLTPGDYGHLKAFIAD